MVGNLGCQHSACPSAVTDTQMVTPGLVLWSQMEVPWSTISGWVDSTTRLSAVSCRTHGPEKEMWSQATGRFDLAGRDAV